MLKVRRAKKGISGAVTALILVIASVIIALVVVGFAFGLFGALGGTPTVNQVGTAIITPVTSSSSGTIVSYQIVVTLHSTGNVQVISAMFTGVGTGVQQVSSATLTPGINTISFTIATSLVNTQLQPGATYTLTLTLSDGQTVNIAALYEG